MFASPHERPLWGERMGEVALPGGCHAWVHAASLGEAMAVPPLVAALDAVQPGARIYLTSTTRTGRERLAALGRPRSLAPIDSPQSARRFFLGIQPERVFLLETELWPHWLLRARAENVPVAIVSARLSERSVRRYRALGSELRGLVGGLDAVLCQGEGDQQRWLALGARPERTRVVGNLKSDGLPEPSPDRAAARGMLGIDPHRPLLVLGCVRPGEARLLARAWLQLPQGLRSAWQVVAVPRHPRAAAELRSEAAQAGVASTDPLGQQEGWRWDDRIGVLIDWYRAADVAFVGGSLASYGGHNPLEPAACGAAVVMGHHHSSQRDAVEAMDRRQAIWIVKDVGALAGAWNALLGSNAVRATRAEAALAVARGQRGSAARAVSRLAEWGLWPA
ncbi:MAG: glycosyltransferase N-terminal domain-containing protein [Candidatus Eisenbacteria bacterium]